MTGAEMTDQELWEGHPAKRRKGFHPRLRPLPTPRSTTTAASFATTSALVEDAVQEVFIDIWRLRKNLTPKIFFD